MMVLSKKHLPRSSPGPTEYEKQPIDDEVHAFLVRRLPQDMRSQASYLAACLFKAGERYDRLTARKEEWGDYKKRGARLAQIASYADELALNLYELDHLSRDDLARKFDPEKLETLIGSLLLLHKEAEPLAKDVQINGKPRDLAEERWILEVADIYENAFGLPASVWGSGAGPANRRGDFYKLLEASRPASFPRHGKLSLRQVERVLERRQKP